MVKYIKFTTIIIFFCIISIFVISDFKTVNSFFIFNLNKHSEKANIAKLKKIEVATCKIRTIKEIIFAEGNVTGKYRVTLSNPSTALIESINVEEGDIVTKGQCIAKCRVEPTLYEVEQAKANLATAKAQYIDAEARVKRQKQIYDSGVISFEKFLGYKMAFVQAKSNLINAKKNLEILNIKLQDIDVFAPVPGIVLERHANPGEYASNILTLSVGKEFLAKVDEMQSHLVYIGMPVSIFLTSENGKKFFGEIKKISSHINTTEHTLDISIFFKNLSEKDTRSIILGQSGYCRMEIQHKVLTIPQSALVNFSLDQAMIFVIKENTASLRSIRFGTSSNGFTEVISGLSKGEKVAVSNLRHLNDGDSILQ